MPTGSLDLTLVVVAGMLLVLGLTLVNERLEAWKDRKRRLGAVLLQISFELRRLAGGLNIMDREIKAVESDPDSAQEIIARLDRSTRTMMFTPTEMVRDLIRDSLTELPGDLIQWWIALERALSNLRLDIDLAKLPPFSFTSLGAIAVICDKRIAKVSAQLERFNTDAKLGIELRAPEFLHDAGGSN